MSAPPFDAEERRAIVAEWQRQAAAWKPRDWHGPGCLMVLAALGLLPGVPTLAKSAALPAALRYGALLLIPVLGIGGFLVMQVRVLPGDPRQIAADAAVLLSGGPGDALARRSAAVALLFHAFDTRGPTLSTGYDRDATRAALGGALEYVRSVEQVLRDELKIHPVFTT